MSKNDFSRRHSVRKSIKPVLDLDEKEDDQRRDIFGRKRVDVIQCLLESSSDDSNDDESNIINQNSHPILSTLIFTKDKQYSKILHGDICFPVRLQTLIKTTSTFIENEMNKEDESNQKRKTICYDCLQIFNEYRRPSQCPVKPPVSQSFSSNLNASQYVQDSHSSVHRSTDTSFTTRL